MVITVSCPSCSTSFPVDSNKIPEKGVNVRCSACRDVFRIERPKEEAPPPPTRPERVFEAEAEPEPVFEAQTDPVFEPEPDPAFETPTFEAPFMEGSNGFEDDAAAGIDFSVGVETPSRSESDWVLEREPDIDPGSLTIEPVDTVESSVEEARADRPFDGGAPGPDLADPMALPAEPADGFFSRPAPVPEPEPEPEPEPAPEPSGPAVGGFSFGKRDPKDKARRLARVLVSDMISYNPERHERALANGSLRADFEEEIQKSWKEYIEQVGEEMATENPFWVEALNDVLAKGQKIF